MPFLTILYFLVAVWLSIYGLNDLVLVFLYLKFRRGPFDCPSLSEFPVVTVQLPVYNERYVVRRAIDAIARLDWPHDRLQIQVLDDSTDETTVIARQHIERYRWQGLDITHIQRTERTGFKAGALNEAMQCARGTFIAIFDADFVPAPDFLQQTIPHLVADPGLGFVQARWGHLNDGFSMITLAQAVALDGHFAIEHVARERAGLMTNFSGTGGVWRRKCIAECGGWDIQMLTEDIDLSYRAQLAGWKGLTLPDVVAPAELPVQLAAFKQQQFRWAKGNIACFMKQGWTILRDPAPLFTRIQALIHLSYYLAHPLMLAVMLATLPLIWYDLLDHWSLACLSLATLGPPLLYTLGQQALYPGWWRRLKALPVLICLGTGLALSNTVAAVEAVLGVKSAFQRTPKFHIEGKSGHWRDRRYALSAGGLIWGEIALTVYALLSVFVAQAKGNLGAIPFLLLYVFGFGYVSMLGLVQRNRRGRSSRAQPKAGKRNGLWEVGSPNRPGGRR